MKHFRNSLYGLFLEHSEDQNILKNDRHNLLTLESIGVESSVIGEIDCLTSPSILKTVQDADVREQ